MNEAYDALCRCLWPDQLRAFVKASLQQAGVGREDTENIAGCLVDANRRGIDSHGVTRLPIYLERKRLGMIAGTTRVEVVQESPSALLLDAHNGWGATAGLKAMELAIERATQYGMGAVAVRRSNHFGIAAFYTLVAAQQGMIGVALTNASPSMPPWGGLAKYLGTNPICVAVPSQSRWPLVYDGATSQVARGKLQMAMQKGQEMPPGWACDAAGNPTTDAQRGLAGYLLPLGGYKGSGLAVIVEVLTGVLAGSAFGGAVGQLLQPQGEQAVSHFFAALRVDSFIPLEQFTAGVEQLSQQIKSLPRQAGVEEILLPGEIEFREEERRDREGIPLTDDVWAQLEEISQQYGVSLPTPIAGMRVHQKGNQ